MRKFLIFFVSFLSLCAISCTKNELSVVDTVPRFEIVEAVIEDHMLELSADLSIGDPYSVYYVYGFEISAHADMADAVVITGHGLGYKRAFSGDYDIYDWNGGSTLYYRACISRKEGENPVYSEIYKVEVPKFEYESLMFMTAGESTIKLENEGGNKPQLFYSYDELNWTRWDYSELEFTNNKPVFINGDNLKGLNKSDSQYSHFSFSGSPVDCYGSIMALIDRKNQSDAIPSSYCFTCLFADCSLLDLAPALPATKLTTLCYYGMFKGCTSLKTAPELPATNLTLANDCYMSMFSGCTSLQSAPKLPATTLSDYCYMCMFLGCTSLQTAPELPATTLKLWCYKMMFKGCTSLNSVVCKAQDISAQYCTEDWLSGVASAGTFVKSKGMNGWTKGASGIPYGWTVSEK